jgi:uncharacterized protein
MKNIKKLKEYVLDTLNRELPGNLTYHGVHHTLHVMEVCEQHLRRLKIKGKDALLLRTAALIHDVGISRTYNDHEAESFQFAEKILPEWGYSKADLQIIKGMIMATQIPQQPHTILERILCDADLDYVGTDKFYEIGDTLYKEFLAYKVIKNEEEWDRLQVNFLSKHRFHTEFSKKHREPVKMHYVQEILNKWGWKKPD